MLYPAPSYPLHAYNNTYDVHFIPEDIYQQSMHNWTKPGGCRDLIQQCRDLGKQGDPNFIGNNQTVNTICQTSLEYCEAYVIGAFDALTGRDAFDVAANASNPCSTFYAPVYFYLKQPSVLASLGVPLNWTWDSNVVTNQFGVSSIAMDGTGDSFRQAGVPLVNDMLKDGIRVSMIFGDRDYRCNWLGAEATANAFAWPNQTAFQNAGYTNITGVWTGRSGLVKQAEQLSLARVFDAGHDVSAYAPETVFRIFNRTMFGTDVATGRVQVGRMYTTKGPKSSLGTRNKLPATMPSTCMVEGKWTQKNPWFALESST